MYSPLRKLVAFFAALAVLFSSVAPAYAQTSTYLCTPSGILFGFFNGVQTTESDAKMKLKRLQRLYGITLPSTGEIIQFGHSRCPRSGMRNVPLSCSTRAHA